MKKIFTFITLFCLLTSSAYAGTCEEKLGLAFTPAQRVQLCKSFGSAVNSSLIPAADNTYDLGSSSFGWRSLYADTSVLTPLVIPPAALTLRLAADSQRLVTFTGTSDTDINVSWGDGGTTAVQDFSLFSSTADADDDSRLNLCGGGAVGSSRGACIALGGNEDSTAGDAVMTSGAAVGSDVIFKMFSTGGAAVFNNSSDVAMWDIVESTGVLRNRTGGSDLGLSLTGTTVAIQEATAGSACMGTLTANGGTPVVTSTTCALTGSRIFLTRTSAETGVVDAWISNITNATSFAITGEAGDTGTYNWIIFHEAA